LLRLNFRSDLKKLVHDLKTTTIYVTHDQIEALSLGDRIAVMRAGEIVQLGTPMEIYERPASRFVGGFIGNPPMNFFSARLEPDGGRVLARVGDHAFTLRSSPSSRSSEIVVGIRAENIRVHADPTENTLPARVEVIEPLGAQLLVTVTVEGSVVKVLTDNDFRADVGRELWLEPVAEKVRWFDPESGRDVEAADRG
ncbi:MAG: ABC transporter ATP-binding protein, partial [Actinomycetota bacterium]